ncbi:MAG: DUF4340 domain-containing protein [Gemmatimonadota bacterium]
MSQGTLKKLVLALIVALVLWGALTLYPRGGRSADASPEVVAFLDGVGDEASIQSVRFRSPDGDSVVLVHSDAGWSVNGFPTDSARVAQFLDVLSEAAVRELVARNAANHDRMGMANDSAYTIEVDADAYTGSLLLGDAGSRYGTTYVRAPDEDEVYLVEGNLSVHARRSLDDWRSKRIVSVDTASVAHLDVTRDSSRYSLSRGDSTWTFADGSEADAAAVRNILTELRDLRGAGFLAEEDSVATLPPGGSIVATSADGALLASIELGSGDNERWAMRVGDTVLYRLGSYRVDRVAPPRERLVPSG